MNFLSDSLFCKERRVNFEQKSEERRSKRKNFQPWSSVLYLYIANTMTVWSLINIFLSFSPELGECVGDVDTLVSLIGQLVKCIPPSLTILGLNLNGSIHYIVIFFVKMVTVLCYTSESKLRQILCYTTWSHF